LAEANQAIRNQLELFNNRIMKLIGRSRRQEFEEIDRPNLMPLPKPAHEYAERKMEIFDDRFGKTATLIASQLPVHGAVNCDGPKKLDTIEREK